jgi:hypothetical protein
LQEQKWDELKAKIDAFDQAAQQYQQNSEPNDQGPTE